MYKNLTLRPGMELPVYLTDHLAADMRIDLGGVNAGMTEHLLH